MYPPPRVAAARVCQSEARVAASGRPAAGRGRTPAPGVPRSGRRRRVKPASQTGGHLETGTASRRGRAPGLTGITSGRQAAREPTADHASIGGDADARDAGVVPHADHAARRVTDQQPARG